jgi:hypothetical protein
MNAKTKQWESYIDEVGRRHWRWPATPALAGVTTGTQGQQHLLLPRQQQATLLPLFVRSK